MERVEGLSGAMERNLKAIVRYDGTGFAGWQVQPEQRTIQGEIEAALSKIASKNIRIHGAGRTDAGVHALGQVFSCRFPDAVAPERLRRSLSRMLGPAIRLEHIEETAPEFHARKSAVGKHYAFTLSLAKEPDPFSDRYSWRVPPDIDLGFLKEVAGRVPGRRDFAGFQGGGATTVTTVRTVESVELTRGGIIGPRDAEDLWRLDFVGNGFLYKMVRNITSTLVDIARGRLPRERLDELFVSRGPFLGHTAPAKGLALVRVMY